MSTLIHQLVGERRYSRAVPAVFNLVADRNDLLRFYLKRISEESIVCPPEGFLCIERCYVFDGKYILDRALDWVEPTIVDFVGYDRALEVIRKSIDERKFQHLKSIDGDRTLVHIAKAGAGNYGHFLTEMAPKIVNMVKANLRKVRIILPEESRKFCGFLSELCIHSGIDADFEILSHRSLYWIEEVIYFTAVSQHNFRKSPTLLELRDVIQTMYKLPPPVPRKRLLVIRRDPDPRKIANGDLLRGQLSEHGYSEIYPGGMTLREQLEVFSQASNVVGSLGAGMTNCLFAGEAAKIFFISPGMVDFFFWDLSCLCKQGFAWYFSQPLHHFDPAVAMADFSVDTTNVLTALRGLSWI